MKQSKYPGRSTLAGHPQLEKILDALVAGKSCRDVAKWTRPSVSYATISRYYRNVVLPTLQQTKDEFASVRPNKNKEGDLEVVQQPLEVLQQVAKEAIIAAPILASRQNRLAAIQDRHDRMALIMQERGEEMKGETAGGASGLLVRDYKGEGLHQRKVFKVDTGLLGEFREHERAMAIELGQWQEAPTPQFAIQIVMPTVQAPTDREANCPIVDIALPQRPNR